MVAAVETTKADKAPEQKRLTMQVEAIAQNTTTLRSQDWDRDRFDIEFGLQNGTTYNSFIIQGEKNSPSRHLSRQVPPAIYRRT